MKSAVQGWVAAVQAFFVTHPLLARFLRDAAEGAIAGVGALVLTVPTSVSDAQREGIVIATAVISAVLAVARRELLPAILEFLGLTS